VNASVVTISFTVCRRLGIQKCAYFVAPCCYRWRWMCAVGSYVLCVFTYISEKLSAFSFRVFK